ncbi:MAG: ABC transporter permease [Planctomycetota bacterium]|jgi:putative ABC transport system permease protein
MRGQIIAIVLIIACGIASYVSVVTAYRGLKDSRDSYYRLYRLAHVWAPVKRAPRAVVRGLETIPGVKRVEGRITFGVTIDMPGLDVPASGQVSSVPDHRKRSLNDLHLVRGRWFVGDGTREVIIAEGFAKAHRVDVGDRLRVLMNNRKQALTVVAIAQSPEYVYLIRGGSDILPDPKGFTVLWMSTTFAEAVFDFKDACNEFSAALDRDARSRDVILELDRHLDRYGAIGAYDRDDQISVRMVNDEIEGLKGTATFVPAVFLGVAAFVLRILMGRLVRTQRGQVALLRAFGYTTREIVAHFLKFTLLVGLGGAALGTALGIWFARGLVGVYKTFYSFPVLEFGIDPLALGTGLAVSLAFAVFGALGALRTVARLDPAEGLRPESPPAYKRTILERIAAVWKRLPVTVRMIWRHLSRTKVRSAMTAFGIALAASILVLAFFSVDATDELMDIQFRLAERQDVRVAFHTERGRAALYELRRLDGVRTAEGEFGVPVKLRNGWRTRRTAIAGLQAGQTLKGLLDKDLRSVPLPRHGLLLSRKLAELIGARVGDEIEVEVLNGRKPRFTVPVESVVDEFFGAFAYADLGRLSRWVGEEMAMTGAVLSVDSAQAAALGQRLKELPAVAAVSFKERTIRSFRDTVAESQAIMNTTLVIFAGVIVFGVLYNAARISLAERERELGSLRVLGYTRREVSFILVGENLTLVAAGLVPGIALGAGFSWLLSVAYDTDLFRFPFVLRPDSIFTTIIVVLGFAVLANAAAVRRLKHQDLVEVLKERE